MERHRFDVFGRTMVAERLPSGHWALFHLGTDGKRRLADECIPPDVSADRLAEYLDDLFHEFARPGRTTVVRLESPAGPDAALS